MSLGDSNLIKIARGLTSTLPRTREEACEMACDLLHSFDRREVRIVAGLLASAATLETVRDSLESELHALSELTETGFIESDDLEPLRNLQKDRLSGSEAEHLEYLASEYL